MLDYEVIDKEENPGHSELIKIKFPDLPDPEVALKLECPRNGVMLEAVTPGELKALTVKGAQAWKASLPLSIYNFPEQRS